MAASTVVASERLTGILRDTIIGTVRRDGPDLSARQLAVLLITYLEPGPHTVRGLAARLDVLMKSKKQTARAAADRSGASAHRTSTSSSIYSVDSRANRRLTMWFCLRGFTDLPKARHLAGERPGHVFSPCRGLPVIA